MFSGPPDDDRAAAAQQAGAGVAPQPTLYLHGIDDGCMGIDIIGRVTDHLSPGSVMVTIPGAGHFFHVEQPDLVNGHILSFLAES
jgi:pimeloyl-ACP methyl ester carboxylesterase